MPNVTVYGADWKTTCANCGEDFSSSSDPVGNRVYCAKCAKKYFTGESVFRFHCLECKVPIESPHANCDHKCWRCYYFALNSGSLDRQIYTDEVYGKILSRDCHICDHPPECLMEIDGTVFCQWCEQVESLQEKIRLYEEITNAKSITFNESFTGRLGVPRVDEDELNRVRARFNEYVRGGFSGVGGDSPADQR